MTGDKNKRGNIKIYIIPFIIITLISAIITIKMSRSIRNNFYELKKEEGLKIARSISTNLSNTALAVETINGLLEEKLIHYLELVDSLRDYYSHDLFGNLANTYDIDEIYVYNPEGIIEYSSSGKYLGWKAEKGHPVYDFMVGDEDLFLGDMRKDTESDLHYKYAYLKNPDGAFIQIGILAEKVNALLDSFRLQEHLEAMVIDGDIVQLYALDKNNIITASTDLNTIGTQINDETIISHLKSGKIYDGINDSNGVDLYEIFVPIDHESEKLVFLGIQYSLDSMKPVIKSNTLLTFVGIIIVYISLIYSILVSYKRNNELIKLAYYDYLTGLPNIEYLKEIINDDKKTDEKQAIIIIRYDKLNLKNITFGYEYGDMILKELANKIKSIENDNIKLFRLTAEKFVLYINSYRKREDLLKIVEKINEIVNEPLIINDIIEHSAVKIGIIEYNDDSKPLDELLKDATIALNYISTSDVNNYSFFDESMEASIQRSEIIERELRTAINEMDFSKIYLVYQPIFDARSKKIVAFEALARMNSDEFGFVSPVEFIDIAEKNQLIIPLSNLILRRACIFIAALLKKGYSDIRVSVNISNIHLLQEDFVKNVLKIISETGITGRNLELEITETIFMENFHIINEKLKELRKEGISISIDDFGTGYSSFHRLSELNVDVLKIDKYFINKISDSDNDPIIARDIISIAHRLGLKTVAEGVELHIQENYLLKYKCDKLQGFLYSKPVPEEEAIKTLQDTNG